METTKTTSAREQELSKVMGNCGCSMVSPAKGQQNKINERVAHTNWSDWFMIFI